MKVTRRVVRGNAVDTSIAIRPGSVRRCTWKGMRLASPIPIVTTASKSPAPRSDITLGRAKAWSRVTVGSPSSVCAWAPWTTTRSTARPGTGTRSPEKSPINAGTTATEARGAVRVSNSRTNRSYPGWCAARTSTIVATAGAAAGTDAPTPPTPEPAAPPGTARTRTTDPATDTTRRARDSRDHITAPSTRAPRPPAGSLMTPGHLHHRPGSSGRESPIGPPRRGSDPPARTPGRTLRLGPHASRPTRGPRPCRSLATPGSTGCVPPSSGRPPRRSAASGRTRP